MVGSWSARCSVTSSDVPSGLTEETPKEGPVRGFPFSEGFGLNEPSPSSSTRTHPLPTDETVRASDGNPSSLESIH